MKTYNNLTKKHAVVITGASSGIGYATALFLEKSGIKVYAGVRNESDKNNLLNNAGKTLCPVILDVCKEDTIRDTYKLIKSECEDYTISLVNNAGVSLNGPLEMLAFSDIKKVMEVNVCGLLSITQTFLPLIRESKGRIINISSGHGLLAIPDKSVYAASKFAVEAISDSLRVELLPFGVYVSNVVVGKVNTNVLGKILEDRKKMIENTAEDIYSLYKTQIDFFDREVKDLPGIDAIYVAKTIYMALIQSKPNSQYLIGPGAKKMKILSRFPRAMRDKMLFKAIYK